SKHIPSEGRRKGSCRSLRLVLVPRLQRSELGEGMLFGLVDFETKGIHRLACRPWIGIKRKGEGFQQKRTEVNLGTINVVGEIVIFKVDENLRARRGRLALLGSRKKDP